MDLVYQDFCNVIRTTAKNSIPRVCRNNHIPYWDDECENLYQTFLQSPEESDSNRVATTLLLRLDKKCRDRWFEAVQTIDFSHSSRKTWSILNKITDRSRRSPRHCAVSANTVVSQLIRNGRYEGIDRESSRKKCQIFGGPLQQVQRTSLKASFFFGHRPTLFAQCPKVFELLLKFNIASYKTFNHNRA